MFRQTLKNGILLLILTYPTNVSHDIPKRAMAEKGYMVDEHY